MKRRVLTALILSFPAVAFAGYERDAKGYVWWVPDDIYLVGPVGFEGQATAETEVGVAPVASPAMLSVPTCEIAEGTLGYTLSDPQSVQRVKLTVAAGGFPPPVGSALRLEARNLIYLEGTYPDCPSPD